MSNVKRFIGRWHGVLLTAITLILIHLMIVFHMPITPTVTLAFIPLTYTAYYAGLWPALASAVLLSLYPFLSPAFAPDRAIQVMVTAFMVAAPMGILKRRARLSDSLNGNLSKVREIRILANYLLEHRREMNEGLTFRFLREIQDRAGNLENAVAGWHQILQEQQEAAKLIRTIRDE